jgi:hypothetical protein
MADGGHLALPQEVIETAYGGEPPTWQNIHRPEKRRTRQYAKPSKKIGIVTGNTWDVEGGQVSTLPSSHIFTPSMVNERVLSIVVLATAFVSQRIAVKLSDLITTLGLDGRIEVFLIIITFSILTNAISNSQKSMLYSSSRVFLNETVLKLRQKLYKKVAQHRSKSHGERKHILTLLNMKVVNFLMSKLSLLEHQIFWRLFMEGVSDFFVMMGIYLTTLYAEKLIGVFFTMWNVSLTTLFLALLPFILFLISLKSTNVKASEILKAEVLESFLETENVPSSVSVVGMDTV